MGIAAPRSYGKGVGGKVDIGAVRHPQKKEASLLPFCRGCLVQGGLKPLDAVDRQDMGSAKILSRPLKSGADFGVQ